MICGHCLLPIDESESGLRYFGFFVAHSENRCLELLRARIAELEADKARLDEIERRHQKRSGLPNPQFYPDVESGNWTGAAGIRMEDSGNFSITTIGDCMARYRLRAAIDAAMKPATFDPAEPKTTKSIP